MPRLLAFLILLTLPSCFLRRAAVNEPLDPETVRSIQPGMPAREVVARLGGPDEVVQLGKRSAYRYSHTIDKGTGTFLLLVGLYNEDSRMDRLWIFFDEDQNVSHVGSTFQSHRAGFHMLPWSDIHTAEDAKAADEERGLK